jgi:DNA-binding MarR family transcriptional regulator
MNQLVKARMPMADSAAPDDVGPDGDSRDLAVVLHDLAWLLPRTVGAEAARAEPLPPSELEIMRLLSRRPGLSVNDVASELGLQPSNVSTAVRSLVDRGVLRRTGDVSDGRVVRHEPTAAAAASRAKRERAWGSAMTEVLDDLPGDDRERLVASITALKLLADRLAGRPVATNNEGENP